MTRRYAILTLAIRAEKRCFWYGIGQSLFTWRQNIDFFADCGYRVIAMDLAGCGFSGHPNIYYTVEENAAIGAFLDAMGIERAISARFPPGAQRAGVRPLKP